MQTVNQYFDHVYVLNLKNRTDRKLAMLQKLNRLGISAEFVSAVNGYSKKNVAEHDNYLKLPLSHPEEIYKKKKMISSPGAWGYMKTYRGILNDAKRRNFQRILCFDDDAVFHKDFEHRFLESQRIIPQDWKILYLGASQHIWNHGFSYFQPDEAKPTDNKQGFYHPKVTCGSFAIGIDKEVFDLLLSEIDAMNCSFDSGALRVVTQVHPEKCFVLDPNIVVADVSDSDIRGGRSQDSMAEKFRWISDDYELPFKFDLASVIIPAYNAEETIEKSIKSVLHQSYPNVEVIVCNDASTDNTENIVKRIQQEDDRLTLLSNPVNQGVMITRNNALQKAKGKSIFIQDADDISLYRRIEKMLIPIYEDNVQYVVGNILRSHCTMEELDLKNQGEMMELVNSRRIKNENGNYSYHERPILGLNSSVFRRSVFDKYGLFEDYRVSGDLEIVERILHHETGNTFDTSFHGHKFLRKFDLVPGIYKRLTQVLVVSSEMNKQNITNQYEDKQDELNRIFEKFRAKYLSNSLDSYDRFDDIDPEQWVISHGSFNTLEMPNFDLRRNTSSDSQYKGELLPIQQPRKSNKQLAHQNNQSGKNGKKRSVIEKYKGKLKYRLKKMLNVE